jgi:hypothetical protein
MTSRAETVRRLRGTPLLCVLALCSGSCDQPLARAHAEVAALASTAQSARAAHDVLEFDLPAEFWTTDEQGRYLVTGFLVGYFATSARPVHTVDVARSSLEVTESTIRIDLPRPRLPADVTRYVLRLQMVTTRGSSNWSDASPPVVMPMSAQAAQARRRQEQQAKRRSVTLDDVRNYPELMSRVERLLPKEPARGDVVSGFLTLEDLAVAVVISEREAVPLDRLGKTVKGPPRRSLRRAVNELKPSARRSNAVQAARGEARKLLTEKSP